MTMELTVRGRIALLLSLTMALTPALRLMADGQAAASADSGTASSVSAAAPAASSPTAGAPALPEDNVDATAPAPATGATEAPSTLPKDKVVVPGPAKPVEAPSRYKAGNFILGFVGGALLAGLGGFLLGTSGPNGIDWAKARKVPVIAAAAGGVVGGVASLWLGAYTPEEARPPQVEGRAPALGLQASLRF
jgi:hypothetical protein